MVSIGIRTVGESGRSLQRAFRITCDAIAAHTCFDSEQRRRGSNYASDQSAAASFQPALLTFAQCSDRSVLFGDSLTPGTSAFLPLIFLGTASGQFLRPAASRLLLSQFLPNSTVPSQKAAARLGSRSLSLLGAPRKWGTNSPLCLPFSSLPDKSLRLGRALPPSRAFASLQ